MVSQTCWAPEGLRKRTARIPAAHEWPRGPCVLLVFRTERGGPLLLRRRWPGWPPTAARSPPENEREEGKEGDLCKRSHVYGTCTTQQTRMLRGQQEPNFPTACACIQAARGEAEMQVERASKAGEPGSRLAPAGKGPRVGAGASGASGGGSEDDRAEPGMKGWQEGGLKHGTSATAERGQVQQSSPQTNTIGKKKGVFNNHPPSEGKRRTRLLNSNWPLKCRNLSTC